VILNGVKTNKKIKKTTTRIIYAEEKTLKDIKYNISDEDLTCILDRLPDNYLNNYSDWIKIGSVCKSVDKYKLFDKWSKKSNKYDETHNNYIYKNLRDDVININWLIKIHNENNDEKIDYVKKIIDMRLLDINKYDVEKMYLNNICKLELKNNIFDDNNTCYIIQSDTGTAKTTVSSKYFKQILETHEDKILLSIVSRVSLGNQQYKTFKDNNLKVKLYSDNHDTDDNVIYTPESLHKYYNFSNYTNHIVFLDEVHSLLSHIIKSDTIHDRIGLFALFSKIIREAYMIVACDATISDCVMEFLVRLRKDKVKYVHNDYKNYRNIKAYNYSDEKTFIDKVINNVKKNEPFIFCFDSLQKMISIHQTILTNVKKVDTNKILLISSEHGDKTIDTSIWTNYNYILFSPKIIYGCDFVPDKKYDVFICVNDYILNCLEVSQQMARNRNIGEVHYHINNKKYELKYKTCEDVEQYYTEFYKQYTELFKNFGALNIDDDGILNLNNNIYTRMFYKYEYYDNVYKSNYKYYFNEILIDKGFDVINVSIKNNINVDIKKIDINEYNTKEINKWLECDKNVDGMFSYNIEKRIEILQIPPTKIDMYKDILIDKYKLQCHFNISKMLKKNDELKLSLKKSSNGILKNLTSINSKIMIIKQFEDILKVNRFDVDHEKHNKKYTEKIEMDKKIYDLYLKMYRQKDVIHGLWGDVYHILIKCYKNVCGNDLIKMDRYTKNVNKKKVYFYKYSINTPFLNSHQDLIKYRSNVCELIEDV
jgi:hypothetical protein